MAGFVFAHVKQYPMLAIAVIGLIAMLIALKTPSAMGMLIETVAGLREKDAGEVSPVAWLGFSYVAFRLMHTILDRRAGRLPSMTLTEYVNYVIFFPAFTAGPIDRIERFIKNLNEPAAIDADGWLEAGKRLARGLFKKFVLADGLAWFALSDLTVAEVRSVGWLWVLLYAYSLRIYFDFSGYTDIAIGLGRLLGIRLPENFDAPYLKPNLTQFWNSWHITLTQWFRSYFFNPLTRAMRSSKRPAPQWLMIFLAQLATMTLIGMWHGLTVGFFLWGLWHGVGLFIHNRWSDWVKSRGFTWNPVLVRYSGMFITFHFVTLGWLFFFLPDPELAWTTMFRLLGAA
jgi:D-alanyl-lipoteichoic acid acyltransferase DltB (MBOAT superfamily)